MSIAIREITNRAPAITVGLGFLIILAFFLPFVNPVSSQDSLKLSFEPENWTDDMKRVKITTLERGLRIRVDIENLDAKDYLVIEYLKIRIETRFEGEDFYKFQYIEVKNISVPPNNATSTYADVDLHYIHGSLGDAHPHLGKCFVRLTYVTAEGSIAFDYNKIEPYPFEFKLASEEEFEKEIKENPSGFVFSPTIVVEVLIISISLAVVLSFLALRKRKKFRL